MLAKGRNEVEAATNRADTTRERSFDELAKGLAAGNISRRDALKLVGGALLGGVLASIPGVAFGQAPAEPGSTLPPRSRAPIPAPGTPPQGTSACPEGMTQCGQLCFDLSTDPCNCGTCGNECMGSGEGRCCLEGQCVEQGTEGATCVCQAGVPPTGCPPGETNCSGTCVNLSTDPENCGTCGNVCMGSGEGRCCLEGQCVEIGTPGATC